MQQDLCDILVTAYCAANGQITDVPVSDIPDKRPSNGKTPTYISRLRLLKKYHFLKAFSADSCIMNAQELVYVEENSLLPKDVIQRDQRLRAGLMRIAEARLADDTGIGNAWKAVLLKDGYSQEEIDGRYQYLHALHLV